MRRQGRRNRPFYRIVVIDSRKRRDGKPIEELGWYNPIQQIKKNYEIHNEKVIFWINQGAQLSDTVKNILKKEGILFRIHLQKQGLDEKDIEYEIQKWILDKEERLKNKKEKTKLSKKQIIEKEKSKSEPKEESVKQEESTVKDSKPAEPKEESVKQEESTVKDSKPKSVESKND